jgi:hypothetical protein
MILMTAADAHEFTTPAPLTPLLQDSMVEWDVLQQRYNIMVPNLLNLPIPVFGVGGPPAAAVGRAMYVSSRTAGCPYCSAHSCSFALRRGATPEKVAAALLPLLPAAIRFDNRAQRGTPKRWPEVGRYLAERTGHNFPVLEKLHSSRARRAVASMLRENLDPASSVIGLSDKVRAGATSPRSSRTSNCSTTSRPWRGPPPTVRPASTPRRWPHAGPPA